MPTANESIRDSLIRHQIHLMRLVGMIRNEVTRALDQTEPAVRQLIENRLATLARASGVDLTRPGAARRVRSLERAVADLRGSAFDNVFTLWNDNLREMVAAEAQFISNAVTASVPVVLNPRRPDDAFLRALVREEPLRGKLLRDWVRDLRRADVERVTSEIRNGLVEGNTSRDIARRVLGTRAFGGSDGATETTRRQVSALTRTAVTHFSNAAKREWYEANSDIITTEVYTATLDARTTPICRALDGRQFPVAEGPYPPLHINCRSVRIAVVDSEVIGERPMKAATENMLVREFTGGRLQRRELLPRGSRGRFDEFARGRVRELTGRVPASMTYGEWLRTQSVEFQNDVLGVTKARLFRRGDLTLDRFVNRRGDELTLAELARRDAAAFRAAGLDPSDFSQAA